jgi:hypothetical protein
MPKIAVYKFLVFFIVSYDLKERFHLHVVNTKGRKSRAAKIWLEPAGVFSQGDLTKAEVALALSLIKKNKNEIKNIILNFAQGRKSKPLKLKLN